MPPIMPSSDRGRAALAASLADIWARRGLLYRLIWREVLGRYRGSWLGLAWSFAAPLFLLALYSFVFGVVFKARWPQQPTPEPVGFALALFAGLIVFGLVSDVLGRAPTLVTSQPNYVKKVVFPLELLPLAALGAALFHALASFGVLLAALALSGRLVAGVWLLPVLLAPLLLCLAGLAWLLAALGVFVRDTAQAMGMVTTALLFLSPVFYPLSALPEALQPWLLLNPLTVPVEAVRAAVLWGEPVDWAMLGGYSLAAIAIAAAGLAFFRRTRPGFADVL